jgi:hypothetical protein
MKKSALILSLAALSVAAQDTWEVIGDSKVVCIHTALLPDSKILCAERPHEDPYQPNSKTNGRVSVEIDLLAPGGVTATVREVQENPFCAGHAQMADGNILMIGGENGTFGDSGRINDPNSGAAFLTDGKKGVRVFINELSEWEMKAPITTERWYPTVATLADGSSIIIGGSTGSFDYDKVSSNILTQSSILTLPKNCRIRLTNTTLKSKELGLVLYPFSPECFLTTSTHPRSSFPQAKFSSLCRTKLPCWITAMSRLTTVSPTFCWKTNNRGSTREFQDILTL